MAAFWQGRTYVEKTTRESERLSKYLSGDKNSAPRMPRGQQQKRGFSALATVRSAAKVRAVYCCRALGSDYLRQPCPHHFRRVRTAVVEGQA